MKAWLLDSPGGLDRLRLTETPDPVAKSGEAIVKIRYAALNPADRYLAEGQYPARPAFPHILGRDGIGIIESVADGVREFSPGQKVLILRSEIGVNRPGTFAEKVAVPVESLIAAPAGWTDEESAGAPLVYLAAYQALMQWGELPPGVVLVTGASGGVGVASLQLAAAMGHTVVALSRDPSKRSKLKELGANITLDPRDTQWRRQLKDALGSRKVDLAIDNIGGTLLPDVIDTLGNFGKVSVVGRLAGPVPQFNTSSLLFRRIRIGGVMVGAYTPAEARDTWTKILALLSMRSAKPLVDSVFAFEDLLKAFDRLAKGPMGKVLIAAPTLR